LVEVFTDKLVAKIPSTCTGIVKEINYIEDEVCLVGHHLLRIEVEGEGDDDAAQTSSSSSEEEDQAVSRSRLEAPLSGPGKYYLNSG
jgi:pyruvate/2-oxoglutarate dehydrogenase complex dihydrolipoamide acyltransferase (E2) component